MTNARVILRTNAKFSVTSGSYVNFLLTAFTLSGHTLQKVGFTYTGAILIEPQRCIAIARGERGPIICELWGTDSILKMA